MKKKPIIFGSTFLLILFVIGGLFYSPGPEETERQTVMETAPVAKKNRLTIPEETAQEVKHYSENTGGKTTGYADVRDSEAIASEIEPEIDDYPDTLEDIKEQIYDLNIEHVSQIELLDDLVQTGDADIQQYWEDDWASADDWKKNSNGFTLEKNEDGGLVFSPDELTARTYTFFENPLEYTYDEGNREFVSETDFYGKTIYNVAKFINNDVLVMMTISGEKVNLQIYGRDSENQENTL